MHETAAHLMYILLSFAFSMWHHIESERMWSIRIYWYSDVCIAGGQAGEAAGPGQAGPCPWDVVQLGYVTVYSPAGCFGIFLFLPPLVTHATLFPLMGNVPVLHL